MASCRLGFVTTCKTKLLGFSDEAHYLEHRKLKPLSKLCLRVGNEDTGTSSLSVLALLFSIQEDLLVVDHHLRC